MALRALRWFARRDGKYGEAVLPGFNPPLTAHPDKPPRPDEPGGPGKPVHHHQNGSAFAGSGPIPAHGPTNRARRQEPFAPPGRRRPPSDTRHTLPRPTAPRPLHPDRRDRAAPATGLCIEAADRCRSAAPHDAPHALDENRQRRAVERITDVWGQSPDGSGQGTVTRHGGGRFIATVSELRRRAGRRPEGPGHRRRPRRPGKNDKSRGTMSKRSGPVRRFRLDRKSRCVV